MGAYLNSQTPYTLYQSESRSPYFVDKTMLLQELFPYVAAGNRHLCVTRPRRFGKTIAANMISSFFQKGIDSGELFDRLKISEADDCQKYKNKYNVIRIDFSKMPRNCESYRQYIERVEELLISDLREAYPDAKTSETDAIGDILEEIFQQYHGEKFIFVLDEWDFIFHRGFITEKRTGTGSTGELQNQRFWRIPLSAGRMIKLCEITGIMCWACACRGS